MEVFVENVYDFLVLGSGIAGLSFALKVADTGRVAIVTKMGPEESSTKYAQGGIASVTDFKTDSFEDHIQDTLVAGAGLCDDKVVRMVVQSGPDRIKELIDYGVEFTRRSAPKQEEYHLTKEGGHSHRRILHADDLTGKEVELALLERVLEHPNITFREHHMGIDLITTKKLASWSKSDSCLGAYVLNKKSLRVETYLGKVTLVCTGGAGKAYLITSNPDVATGDGIAMAYRAGGRIANMEFIQFHPTCLYHPHARNFLISEAVRGEGGVLVDGSGIPFMEKYHPQKSLAPRDVVARAIDNEIKRSGSECVYLDISHVASEKVLKRFPNIHAKCLSLGIDITKEPIPVAPAAHYCCGGVMVDRDGQTSIGNLFAVGEVSYTGLHGANRLASNSLLEAVVYAHRAAEKAMQLLPDISFTGAIPDWDSGGATDSDEEIIVTHNWDEIRRTMINYVGIVRSNKRLERAARRIDILQQEIQEYYWNFTVTPNLLELRNIAMVAELIVRCARKRRESRGLHYNIDYKTAHDECLKPTLIQRKISWLTD